MKMIYGNNFFPAHLKSIQIRALTRDYASRPAYLINKTPQSIQRAQLNSIQNRAKASNLARPHPDCIPVRALTSD